MLLQSAILGCLLLAHQGKVDSKVHNPKNPDLIPLHDVWFWRDGTVWRGVFYISQSASNPDTASGKILAKVKLFFHENATTFDPSTSAWSDPGNFTYSITRNMAAGNEGRIIEFTVDQPAGSQPVPTTGFIALTLKGTVVEGSSTVTETSVAAARYNPGGIINDGVMPVPPQDRSASERRSNNILPITWIAPHVQGARRPSHNKSDTIYTNTSMPLAKAQTKCFLTQDPTPGNNPGGIGHSWRLLPAEQFDVVLVANRPEVVEFDRVPQDKEMMTAAYGHTEIAMGRNSNQWSAVVRKLSN